MQIIFMKEKDYNIITLSNKLYRLVWNVACFLLIRPLPRTIGQRWIHFVYRLFGASIDKRVLLYPSAIVYDPRNLIMKEHSQIGPKAEIYNVNKVVLEEFANVSQRAYLCTASHDINNEDFHLISEPIVVKRYSWVAADAFIGFGVTIGEGAVVGARAAVFKDVVPWTVVGGNPARYIKNRNKIVNNLV